MRKSRFTEEQIIKVLKEHAAGLKDSLWSVDLFRCESILLRSHWVMVVMDVFTRRIIGFGVERVIPLRLGLPDVQPDHRRKVASSAPELRPRPIISFPSLAANLRTLEVEEIKSIPYVPVSDPFVERLIGTIRRKFLTTC